MFAVDCVVLKTAVNHFFVVVVVVVVLLFFILFIFTCDFYLELGYRQIWKVKSIIILSASSLSGQVI